MKRVTIWRRDVLERTGYRKYPFKKVVQYVIEFDSVGYDNGHGVNVEDPKLRIKFVKVLETKSKKDVRDFIGILSKREADKWLKSTLEYLCQLGGER